MHEAQALREIVMTTALNDVQRELASAIAQGVVTGMKPPAEASTAQRPSLEEILRQSKPGTTIKFGDLDIKLPEKDDPADKPSKVPAKATVNDDDSQTVELGQQLLGIIEKPLNSVKLPGIGAQTGAVVVGAGVGVLVAEVINGMTPRVSATGGVATTNAIVKVAAIGAIGVFGNKLMSPNARLAAAGVIGAQLVADILPLDQWVTKIVNLLKGGTGAGQRLGNRTSPGYVMNQPMPIRHGVGADAISRGGR